MTVLIPKNSPPNLGDALADLIGASTYIKVFMVDGSLFLPPIDLGLGWKVVEGKVAECVGKALLLPKDMGHWVKWNDESLLLNMKREVIMVIYHPFEFLLSFSFLYLCTFSFIFS